MGRAQREAARCRKSNCRDNFGWFKFRGQQRHLANQSEKLSEIAPKFHLGGSTWAPITFLFVDQSSLPFFAQRGSGCSWSATFPIFDMWICSGDICDQTRKLSEIALTFRRFLPSQILGGGPSPKIVPTWTPLSRGTSRRKVSWRYFHCCQSYRRSHPEF